MNIITRRPARDRYLLKESAMEWRAVDNERMIWLFKGLWQPWGVSYEAIISLFSAWLPVTQGT
jgi:hypothetical protein